MLRIGTAAPCPAVRLYRGSCIKLFNPICIKILNRTRLAPVGSRIVKNPRSSIQIDIIGADRDDGQGKGVHYKIGFGRHNTGQQSRYCGQATGFEYLRLCYSNRDSIRR